MHDSPINMKDIVETAVASIPLETLKRFIEQYNHYPDNESSLLNLRSNLAIAARRALDLSERSER